MMNMFLVQDHLDFQAQQNTINNTKAAYKETKAAVKKELKNIEQNAKNIINMFKGKK